MEQMNSTQSPSMYGVNVVEYGGGGGGGGDHVGAAGSMMALMTQHEPEMTSVVPTSFSCYNHSQSDQCLLSAAMFQSSSQGNKHMLGGGGHLTMDHFQTAVISDSSMSSVKTETCSPLSSQFELIGTKDDRRRFYAAEPSFVVSPLKEGENHNSHGHGPHSQGCSSSCKQNEADAIKTKIMAHIHYPRLLAAYVDCQKVGAPPEVVTELNELSQKYQDRESLPSISIGADPELDQFMEAYCELFMKLQEELAKPFKEAMAFLKKVEAQLGPLSNGPLRRSPSGEGEERGMSSGDGEDDGSVGEMEYQDMEVDPHAEDRELKDQLLRKYSGYLSSLKQEFLKKKKKGKLPKEARQKLLEWWTTHYKWPYPSEAQKIALAESTGLDQKQINNWFINQRKRHWKPTEEMQFVVMDGSNPHTTSLYLEAGHLRSDGSTFTMDC